MKVKAYINHGRWIADCPNCGGAEVAQKESGEQEGAGGNGGGRWAHSSTQNYDE